MDLSIYVPILFKCINLKNNSNPRMLAAMSQYVYTNKQR